MIFRKLPLVFAVVIGGLGGYFAAQSDWHATTQAGASLPVSEMPESAFS